MNEKSKSEEKYFKVIERLQNIKTINDGIYGITGGTLRGLQEDIKEVLQTLKDYEIELEENYNYKCEMTVEYNEKIENLKNEIEYIISTELPDKEICMKCNNYDVNGVVIRQKLEKILEDK